MLGYVECEWGKEKRLKMLPEKHCDDKLGASYLNNVESMRRMKMVQLKEKVDHGSSSLGGLIWYEVW